MSDPTNLTIEGKLVLAESDVRLLRTELDLALKRGETMKRQRDEARANHQQDREGWDKTAERMETLMKSLTASRDEARAEVERLRAIVVELREAFVRDAGVAERQREACAYYMIQEQDYSAQACRRAPLVTDK